jgi:anthranilate synthase component 1
LFVAERRQSMLEVARRELLEDAETPISAVRRLGAAGGRSVLLESAEVGEGRGRYSFVGSGPLLTLTLRSGGCELQGPGMTRGSYPAADFFDLLKRVLRTLGQTGSTGLPFVGSLCGYVGYDAVRLVETSLPPRESGEPVSELMLFSRNVVFDHWRRTVTLAGIGFDGSEAREALAETGELLSTPPRRQAAAPGELDLCPPDGRAYMGSVSCAREHILAGDIFQVVLADRYTGTTSVDPLDVYRRLRAQSPAPYMFYLSLGDFRLFGSSPETMVRVSGGRVTVRPIAGTRPRSEDKEEDRRLERELLESEKENAEHLMLVDLARNDVGRVSVPGTVRVEPFGEVQRFSHVMHLVSEVSGELAPGEGCVDAFKAAFPAGTVSGAPKLRAMEIIDDLEDRPRGPYAGAVGYFSPQGSMDTCICIRMMSFRGRSFEVPVGAGIVADSRPESELAEIGSKAAQSLCAVRNATGGTK